MTILYLVFNLCHLVVLLMCLILHIRFVSFAMLKKTVFTKYLCLLSQKLFFPGTHPNGPRIPPGFPHYWVDRVTTGTWSFLSSGSISGNRKFSNISKVLQKLLFNDTAYFLKHFNGTAISTVLVLALESSFPVIIVFNWNNSESVVLYGSSLWYCHKLLDFSHPFIKIFSILYLHIIYFPDEVSNLWTIF